MQTGTVKTITDRGYGFLSDGHVDYFFHTSDLLNCDIDTLSPGDKWSSSSGSVVDASKRFTVRAIFLKTPEAAPSPTWRNASGRVGPASVRRRVTLRFHTWALGAVIADCAASGRTRDYRFVFGFHSSRKHALIGHAQTKDGFYNRRSTI